MYILYSMECARHRLVATYQSVWLINWRECGIHTKAMGCALSLTANSQNTNYIAPQLNLSVLKISPQTDLIFTFFIFFQCATFGPPYFGISIHISVWTHLYIHQYIYIYFWYLLHLPFMLVELITFLLFTYCEKGYTTGISLIDQSNLLLIFL